MNRLSRETFWGPFSLYGFLIALAGFGVDRFHKWWMLDVYDITSRGRVEVTSFFDLVMAWNKGVSYGLFEAETALGVAILAIFALAVSLGLALWLARVDMKWTAIANIADVWIALGVALIILESVWPGLFGSREKDGPDGKAGDRPA